MSSKKYVFTGGGTAGHITPILAVAEKLQAMQPDALFVYIGAKNDPNKELVTSHHIKWEVREILAGKFRRYHGRSALKSILDIKTCLLNIRDIFRVGIGFWQAFFIMWSLKADALFMKGGYVGVPICVAAWLLGMPYVTHDSDAIPGLANKLVSRGARYNAVGTVHGAYPYKDYKTVVTGLPLASLYEERIAVEQGSYKEKLGISGSDQLVVCIMGTQGSRAIDTILEKHIPKLLEELPRLHVLHVFGRLNEESYEQRYVELKESARKRLHIESFVKNAPDWIAAADVFVGRAGATSLAEVGMIGRACVIIPAEHLTGGHQIKNAIYLEKQGAVILVKEKNADDELGEVLKGLLQNKEVRFVLETEIRKHTIANGSVKLAQLLAEVAV